MSRGFNKWTLRDPLHWFGWLSLSFVLVFFVVPVAWLLGNSIYDAGFSLAKFSEVLQGTGYLKIALNTLWISFITALITFLLGYPIAYLIVSSPSRLLRQSLLIAVISSQLISVLVRTFAWEVILGATGPLVAWTQALSGWRPHSLLFTRTATTIGLVHYLLPFMVLPLMTVMQRINPDTVRSAQTLGAGAAVRFFRVFVPLTIAGIGVGTTLIFVYSLGSFATPSILGGRKGIMMSVAIESALNELGDYGLAAVLSLLILVVAILVVLLYRWLLSGKLEWLANPEAIDAAPRARMRHERGRSSWLMRLNAGMRHVALKLDAWGVSDWRWPRYLFIAVSLLFILGPEIVTLGVSFSGHRSLVFPPSSYSWQWFDAFFSERWLMPTWISVQVALVASIMAVLVGGSAAICVARLESVWMRKLLPLAMLLPLLIPSVVTASAYYIVLLKLNLNDTVTGIVLAHTCLLLPFSFTIIFANLRAIAIDPEQIAQSLGARPLYVIRRILIPQMYSGVVIAFLLCVIVSFDEAVAGIFLSGVNTQTLPAYMFAAISKGSDPTVAVPGTLMLFLALICWLAFRFSRRRFIQTV